MIKEFVTRFMENKYKLEKKYSQHHPGNYFEIVRDVIYLITAEEYNEYSPDPNRIHEIDDGDYQGTLLFIIAEKGYQPSQYYYVCIYYGSCSGCDTLKAIYNSGNNPPDPTQTKDYMTLALHIVQKLRKMEGECV